MSETHVQHFPHIIIGDASSLATLRLRANHILNTPSRFIEDSDDTVIVRVLVTSAQEKIVEDCGFQIN